MNKENFEKLPEEKKKIIEEAYYAAFKKEIAPSDFFAICRRTLTEAEYLAVFSDKGRSVASSPVAAAAAPSPSAPKERPVEEIKTEHLEDIMQYSGIDLKEEADNIVKEAEHHVSTGVYDEIDPNNHIAALFNPVLFKEFLFKICSARNLSITEDGIKLLFEVMTRKLLDLLDRLDETCRTRTESGLSDYNFQIDNEATKQLWYLNELEKGKVEKLMIKKDEDQKKKKVIQEREDLLIKKRQSNTVAMAAMGLKQRSWMTSTALKSNEDSCKFNSIYSPFDEKAFDDRIKNCIVTMKDLLYVLERDKRYNKSIFLIQHYFK